MDDTPSLIHIRSYESMTNNKKRLNVYISEDAYKKLDNYLMTNKFIDTRLTKGSAVELGLYLLFKSTEDKGLNELAIEFLQSRSGDE